MYTIPPVSARRSEGIGSLLRPQYLLEARQQLERGEIAAAGPVRRRQAWKLEVVAATT
jgi:hypothetical protein